MAAGPSLDPARFLHEHLSTANPDLLRELLGVFIDALMGALHYGRVDRLV